MNKKIIIPVVAGFILLVAIIGVVLAVTMKDDSSNVANSDVKATQESETAALSDYKTVSVDVSKVAPAIPDFETEEISSTTVQYKPNSDGTEQKTGTYFTQYMQVAAFNVSNDGTDGTAPSRTLGVATYDFKPGQESADSTAIAKAAADDILRNLRVRVENGSGTFRIVSQTNAEPVAVTVNGNQKTTASCYESLVNVESSTNPSQALLYNCFAKIGSKALYFASTYASDNGNIDIPTAKASIGSTLKAVSDNLVVTAS